MQTISTQVKLAKLKKNEAQLRFYGDKNDGEKFLHHSTSSFLVPCSIFQITSCQFAGRRPNGMLTRGTRARTQALADTN